MLLCTTGLLTRINGKPSHTEDIDFLRIQEGDTLTLSDKILDEEEGESTFRIKAGHITDKTPLPGVEFPGYTLIQFVPMSSMDALGRKLQGKTAAWFLSRHWPFLR